LLETARPNPSEDDGTPRDVIQPRDRCFAAFFEAPRAGSGQEMREIGVLWVRLFAGGCRALLLERGLAHSSFSSLLRWSRPKRSFRVKISGKSV